MASFLSQPGVSPSPHKSEHKNFTVSRPQPKTRVNYNRIKCCAEKKPATTANNSHHHQQLQLQGSSSEPENALLKLAWYGSELLGIAASIFRSPDNVEDSNNRTSYNELIARDGSDAIDRANIIATIKQDFERSYFVTGNLTLYAYEENCEFADPAGSFKGLKRFKRNCTNFGSLLERSNMKLMKWEDFEDKGVGHWRFSCILVFPWRPILSATGYTEYYFDAKSGRVCRHVEHWNVPKMTLLKQILKPSRRISRKGI